ncbi:hypothetical protein GP486_000638 [Trichoglossum hirsutum]|uniref:DUF7708 domain-containing protein n=1 Tax=Trichoglossum hirsutum TaxID=265104 RepID=A0A9P8LIF0_9PEZI|nr:hypothetical protein GP486_000638 [Trichoglossum hirsutum]
MAEAAQTKQLLAQRDSVTNWYGANSITSSGDFARESFEEAVKYFEKELTRDQYKKISLQNHHSIQEVQKAVLDAKKAYDGSSNKKKVQKWLQKFSSQIMYYGAVLDTLAQHHPEYVALAWGTVKFVFIGVLNHAELLVQFSKALAKIGEVLPRTELNAVLYPTSQMKEAITTLYAYIIRFLQQAVKWYKMSPAGRAFSSIRNPFDLSLKDTVEKINECSRAVDQIASAASRAELRDLHIKINELMQVAMRTQSITNAIHVDMQDQKSRIWDLQLSQIIELLVIKPRPEETYLLCLSIAKRRQNWNAQAGVTLTMAQNLSRWASEAGSSLLIVRAGRRAGPRAKDLATNIISLLLTTPHKVIWFLSTRDPLDQEPTTKDVLKSLISQALRHNPHPPSLGPDQLSVAQFHSDHTEAEWLDLLCLILKGLPGLFIIVETDKLFQTSWNDSGPKLRFIELFQRIVDLVGASGPPVKILIVSYGVSAALLAPLPGSTNRLVTCVQQLPPVPPRLRRPAGRGRGSNTMLEALHPVLVGRGRPLQST